MDRDELSVGAAVHRDFVVSDAAVRAFAEVSGDHNPVHVDEAYARGTLFRGRVAHGMLIGGHISAVLGEQLPGPGAIYLGQTLNFEHPVRIGDTVTISVTITAIEGPRAVLSTIGRVGETVVVEGEARVVLPRRRRAKGDGA